MLPGLWLVSLKNTITHRKQEKTPDRYFQICPLLTFCYEGYKRATYGTVPKWCTLLAHALTVRLLCCQFWHICNTFQCLKKYFDKYLFRLKRKSASPPLPLPCKSIEQYSGRCPGYLIYINIDQAVEEHGWKDILVMLCEFINTRLNLLLSLGYCWHLN